uniref:Uncharacterized protein n=1 Tax=Podoviridae sp. ctrTt13 TaxID=2825279 RepID=A0A8S5NSS7_9CAUD|nr:MAG TPA: hypothetical protein [Podoviridae sp. ctrTt13]
MLINTNQIKAFFIDYRQPRVSVRMKIWVTRLPFCKISY